MSIEIIFVMANYCGYCHAFKPIYENAKKSIKKHKFLKNYDVTFSEYDFDGNNEKAEKHEIDFNNDHPEIINNVDGFPNVFVKINNKTGDGNVYAVIQHTVNRNGLNEATNNFLNNVANEIKTIESGGKEKYVTVEEQVGGNSMIEDVDGFDEYLKYKTKYLTMKQFVEK